MRLGEFPSEKLLATLPTFRLLYFAVPLLFAAVAFDLHELRVAARNPTTLPGS